MMILEPPRVTPKGMGAVMAYPFWATVTALAKHMRGNIMQVVTDFLGDALNYIGRGSEVRWLLHAAVIQACALRPHEPLVLIGHSMGGIISYEYLIDPNPNFRTRPEEPLLITVGSPVALFAEYDLFAQHGTTARATGGMRWINIYDPDDLLSFPVAGVFPERADGDRSCGSGRPFPASHGAYWQNDTVFTAIAEAFPAQEQWGDM
jgi:pimeloyl-ACP methyl ester carboxylesterase